MAQKDQCKRMRKIRKTDVNEGRPKIKILHLIEFARKNLNEMALKCIRTKYEG